MTECKAKCQGDLPRLGQFWIEWQCSTLAKSGDSGTLRTALLTSFTLMQRYTFDVSTLFALQVRSSVISMTGERSDHAALNMRFRVDTPSVPSTGPSVLPLTASAHVEDPCSNAFQH